MKNLCNWCFGKGSHKVHQVFKRVHDPKNIRKTGLEFRGPRIHDFLGKVSFQIYNSTISINSQKYLGNVNILLSQLDLTDCLLHPEREQKSTDILFQSSESIDIICCLGLVETLPLPISWRKRLRPEKRSESLGCI